MFEEHCIIDMAMTCITDVYFVALVVLLQVYKVVSAGNMWCPCLLDSWVEIGLLFAAQGQRDLHCSHAIPRDMRRLRQWGSFKMGAAY